MWSQMLNYLTMTKPRAMVVVLLTSAAGYFLALDGAVDWSVLFSLLAGAGLSGGGSIVLNQYMERDYDLCMERTRHRPLPAGLIAPQHALIYGVLLSVVGTMLLAVGVNALTATLGGLCVLSYVLVYTPMKRRTPWNTAVGAIPGAIPPMMGWTAVTGRVDFEAWVLFAILFVWQYPHFLALGWLYRRDYAGAGYRMLSGLDRDGSFTARQVVVNACALTMISLIPARMGWAGPVYGVAAPLLGAGLVALGVYFHRQRSDLRARLLLRGTIAHISVLMLLMVLDRSA